MPAPLEAFKRLRDPFAQEQIGKLPRAGIQLDYVGHAAVTDRLLEVDPYWTWEPVAWGEDGAPLITLSNGNRVLWIKLTVLGVTRMGVGIVRDKTLELEKQLISDALRNAAMRFGVALDLWSKEDLSGETPDGVPSIQEPDQRPLDSLATSGEAADVSSDEIPLWQESLADAWDIEELQILVSEMDPELKQKVKEGWKWGSLKEGAQNPLLREQSELARAFVRTIYEDQQAIWDLRRKGVFAALGKINVKSDDNRHELINKATEGQTSSAKQLTADQYDAIIDYCKQLGEDDEK